MFLRFENRKCFENLHDKPGEAEGGDSNGNA
jgi:hypothetical protein